MIEQATITDEKLLKLLFLIKVAEKIEGKTRLHKIVFLGKQEENIDLGFDFTKYNYGPYSFELTKALEGLETSGLIKVETILLSSSDSNGFQTKQFSYTLTPKGSQLLQDSKLEESKKEVVDKIKQLVEKWNKVSRQKIIEHVYSNYM